MPTTRPGRSRHNSPIFIAFAVSAVLAAALMVIPSASATGSGTGKSSKTAIDVRVIAQQGLAIALASNVLQSQITVLVDSTDAGTGCIPMGAGVGSSKVLRKVMSGDVTASNITIYYNGACTHPYIEADAHMVSKNSSYAITESAVYLGTSGATLGVLRVTEVAVIAGSKLSVHGVGTFAPHDGAPVVHLGLSCSIPSGGSVPPPFVCEGGIAQKFPVLGVSLGSVTPITLTLKAAGTDQFAVSFASSRSMMERDTSQALSIGTTPNALLKVNGGGTAFTSDTTTGRAGRFALFPPTPTGWTISDTTAKVVFAISVLNNASRELRGSITTTSGKTLATLDVDRSGTGSITYVHGKTDPITNWLLSG
jgi:hypothetical protein